MRRVAGETALRFVLGQHRAVARPTPRCTGAVQVGDEPQRRRTALEDVEVGGTAVRKGEAVLCLLGAANRDPEVYPEPDRLDITRQNIRPLSFFGGIHFCLGAQLARNEAEIGDRNLAAPNAESCRRQSRPPRLAPEFRPARTNGIAGELVDRVGSLFASSLTNGPVAMGAKIPT